MRAQLSTLPAAGIAGDAQRAPVEERTLASVGDLRKLRRRDDEDLLQRVIEIGFGDTLPSEVPEQRATMRCHERAQALVLGDGHR